MGACLRLNSRRHRQISYGKPYVFSRYNCPVCTGRLLFGVFEAANCHPKAIFGQVHLAHGRVGSLLGPLSYGAVSAANNAEIGRQSPAAIRTNVVSRGSTDPLSQRETDSAENKPMRSIS